MNIVALIIFSLFLFILYKRYMPVLGLSKRDWNNLSYSNDEVVFVDTRDYQISKGNQGNHVYGIPLAYLNRHFIEIPDQDIVIIASDIVEKNLSARILRRKGFRVIGYTISGEEGSVPHEV